MNHRTPLYEQHCSLGAKFIPFGDWEMPVEYEGILKEHQTVRSTMGLFDVSHMGEIEIRGESALEYCQMISTNDVSLLKPGTVQYSAILNERGGIIDDCTVYCLDQKKYLYVINASRRSEVIQWFQNHVIKNVVIEDISDKLGLLALQGRKAEDFLDHWIAQDLKDIGYYSFVQTILFDVPVMISRTGYSGEDGFEIYIPLQHVQKIWNCLLHEGRNNGLIPVGLGARDTLRLEMGYLLNGEDMNKDVTPLEVGLGWIVKMNKGNFIGRERLVEQKEIGVTKRLRGIQMIDKGIPRAKYEVWNEDVSECVGHMTSGTFSPSLKLGIGLAMLKTSIDNDDSVNVKIRDKNVRAKVVKPPFVKGSIKK